MVRGEPEDVQRRFGAALVTAHAMREVDPVARVTQDHLLREARARYTDADAWMQAAVLGYIEAMAELRDRDEGQATADRDEDTADALEASHDPDRVGEGALAGGEGREPQSDVGSGAEVTAGREEALADRQDGRSVDDLERALD